MAKEPGLFFSRKMCQALFAPFFSRKSRLVLFAACNVKPAAAGSGSCQAWGPSGLRRPGDNAPVPPRPDPTHACHPSIYTRRQLPYNFKILIMFPPF